MRMNSGKFLMGPSYEVRPCSGPERQLQVTARQALFPSLAQQPCSEGRAELCALPGRQGLCLLWGSGFSHPGNPQRGCPEAECNWEGCTMGKAVARVWGLWRPSYLNRCSQAVDSQCLWRRWRDHRRACFSVGGQTRWLHILLRGDFHPSSPQKGVEVEALMKSGSLGLPAPPQLQPMKLLVNY